MKLTARIMFCGIWAAVVLLSASTVSRSEEYSHARIVRLSFVEGAVTVQRPDIEEWAEALVNTPIQEGFKISTAEDGFTEIEFENTSTARLGQFSLIEFAQLILMPDGAKVNRLRLHQGYATFNVVPEGDDLYEVMAGDATIKPHGKARFRLDLEEGLLLLKVFKGSVEISSPEGTGTVGENAMLELRPGAEPAFQISQGITKDAWDEWVEERDNQVQMARHAQAPSAASNVVSDLIYGLTDLLYFGEWVNVPEYGSGWVPDVPQGWVPYTAGRWCYYPLLGYTWISSEPWGWLPYHYGNWVYEPRIGWCWIPGAFTSWSPGQVTWYRGPGWVGWAPQGSPRLHGGSTDCRNPRGCGVAVSEDTFRNGRPIRPGRTLDFDPETHGRRLERPDIEPDRLARLPGEPYRQTGVPQRPREPGQIGSSEGGRVRVRPPQAAPVVSSAEGNQPSTSLGSQPGVSRGRGPSSAGIVFDPEQRRYVNGPAPGKRPASDSARQAAASNGERGSQATPQTSRAMPGEARRGRSVESPGGAHRPGPQGNYPSRSVASPVGEPAEVREHVPISPGISLHESAGSSSRGTRDASSHLGSQDIRSNRDRSSESSSAGRAVPDSSSRTSSSSSSHISSGRESGSRSESSSRSDSSSRSSDSSSGGTSRSEASSDSGSRGSRDSNDGGSRGGSGDSHGGSGGRPPR